MWWKERSFADVSLEWDGDHQSGSQETSPQRIQETCKGRIMITCKLRTNYYGEHDCEYDQTIGCDDCICNGGRYSPVTGKVFRGNRKKYITRARKIKGVTIDINDLFEGERK